MRSLTILASTCLFFFPSTAAVANPARCPVGFRGLVANDPALERIGLSSLDLDILNRAVVVENLRFPHGRPQEILKRLVRGILTLAPAERRALARQLRAGSPFSEKLVQMQAMLALADKPTWDRFLRSIVSDLPDESFFFPVDGFWAHEVKNLPEKERLQILEVVKRHYGKAKSTSDGRGSPKRDLDYLAHAVLQGGERINESIRSGAAPLLAYGNFLREQNRLLFRPDSQRGGYDEKSVLVTLRAIQKSLSPEELPVLIGGSFPAGRANLLRSDVDYMANGGPLEKKLEAKVSRAINAALKERGIRSALRFENFPGEIGRPRDRSYPGDLASSNPVLFYVDSKRIEMRIYPTKLRFSGSDEDTTADPLVYELSPPVKAGSQLKTSKGAAGRDAIPR